MRIESSVKKLWGFAVIDLMELTLETGNKNKRETLDYIISACVTNQFRLTVKTDLIILSTSWEIHSYFPSVIDSVQKRLLRDLRFHARWLVRFEKLSNLWDPIFFYVTRQKSRCLSVCPFQFYITNKTFS